MIQHVCHLQKQTKTPQWNFVTKWVLLVEIHRLTTLQRVNVEFSTCSCIYFFFFFL